MSAAVEEIFFPSSGGTDYLRALDHLYCGSSNGQVLFKRFRFHNAAMWDRLFHPSMLHTIASFVNVPQVAAAFGGVVHGPACPCHWHKADVQFETRYPVEWPGTLARLLWEDTVFGKGLPEQEALHLASAHLGIIHPAGSKWAAFSDRTWCSFFRDIGVDHTFIAWDTERTMSMLLLTDTD